jgi:hypothetical protein
MGNKKAQNAKGLAATGSRYGGTKPESKFKSQNLKIKSASQNLKVEQKNF